MMVVGYLVATVLFAQLNGQLAGQIMATLLQFSIGFTTLAIGVLLLWGWYQRICLLHLKWYLGALLLLLVINFVLSPWMQALKQRSSTELMQSSPEWVSFAVLHGFYQLLYLLVILALLWSAVISVKVLLLRNKKH